MSDKTSSTAGPHVRTRATVFFLCIGLGVAVGATIGYQFRPDLLGMSLGVLVLCAPLTLVAIVVGVVQTMRETARDEASRREDG